MSKIDEMRGFVNGLAYALAQNNDGKAVMGPISVPMDEFDRDAFEKAVEYINEECSIFDYRLELERHPVIPNEYGFWHIWLATTENDEGLDEHWADHITHKKVYDANH